MLDRDRPNCQVIRRKLVRYGWFGARGLNYSPPGHEEWVVEECGTILFTEKERHAKTCANCSAGLSFPRSQLFDVGEFDREFLKSVGVEQD